VGEWMIVIQGHGMHDNGREDDADAICARFLTELAKSQGALSCVFAVGVSREIKIPEVTETLLCLVS